MMMPLDAEEQKQIRIAVAVAAASAVVTVVATDVVGRLLEHFFPRKPEADPKPPVEKATP